MTKYLTSLLVVIMILFPLTSVAQNTEAPVKKIKQMLYPNCNGRFNKGRSRIRYYCFQ